MGKNITLDKLKTLLEPILHLISKCVKSVNGVYPDKDGNVELEIDSGLPAGGEPHQMLVTDADGKTVWEERPYYRKTEKIHFNEWFGEEAYPITVTTEDGGGVNFAQDEGLRTWEFAPAETFEVRFDGNSYMCELKETEYFGRYIGATPRDDDTFDFKDFPFCIASGFIATEHAGEHTVDFYPIIMETKINYGNTLHVFEDYNNGQDFLNTETVEKILAAQHNGIPVVIASGLDDLGISLNVTTANNDFIYASGAEIFDDGMRVCAKKYNTSDGSILNESAFYGGRVISNGNKYPLMYINNRWYKITVDSSGNLKATEEK